LCDAAVVAERASDFYGGTMDSNKFDDAGAPAARPALRRAVEEASGLPWAEARTRWDVSNVDHDPKCTGECVCGQEGLAWLFTIQNRDTGALLYPIGSECIRYFEVDAMARQARDRRGLLELELAVRDGVVLDLKTHFSRARIESLHDAGVISIWQRDDLMNAFNRRPGRVSPAEWRGVDELLRTVVTPALGGVVRPPSVVLEERLRDEGSARLRSWARSQTGVGLDVLGLDAYALDVLHGEGVLTKRESAFLRDMSEGAARGWGVSPRQRAWMDSLLVRVADYARASLGGAA